MTLSKNPPASVHGSLALVQYVDEPLRSFLNSLRSFIPGKQLPPPHITVLPPRPLRISIEDACAQIRAFMGTVPAFEVELSRVCHFEETNFLYLDVSEGSRMLHDIHAQLNQGDLGHLELFEFRPHLTLGGPIPVSDLGVAQELAEQSWKESKLPQHVSIVEIVCLWLPPESEGREWVRYGSFALPKDGRAMAAHAANQDSKILS